MRLTNFAYFYSGKATDLVFCGFFYEPMGKPFFYIMDVIVFPIMLTSLGAVVLAMGVFFHATTTDELVAIHGTISLREIRSTVSDTRSRDYLIFQVREYNNEFQDDHIGRQRGFDAMEIDAPIIFSIRKCDSERLNSGCKLYTWSTTIKGKEYVAASRVTSSNRSGIKIFMPCCSLLLFGTAIYTFNQKRRQWRIKLGN